MPTERVLCRGSQRVLLPLVRTIARFSESSFGWLSAREGESGGVAFVHPPIPRVLAVTGDCKAQREGHVMSFCTSKLFTVPKPLCIILLQALLGLK